MRWIFAAVLLAQAPTEQPPRGRQTVGGAWERADRRLEIINRGARMRQQNEGAQGRINATNDAAVDAELPRAVRSGSSNGWSPW